MTTYTKCNEEAKNVNIVNIRNNRMLNAMIEGEGAAATWFNMENLKKDYPQYFTNFNEFVNKFPTIITDDAVGNPYLKCTYMNYKISTSLPRYLWYAFDIINELTKSNIKNVKIFEIGGGYGILARILLRISKKYNIKIKKYSMVDVDNIVKLQKKYLDYFNFDCETNFINFSELYKNPDMDIDCNLIISSGSLGEIGEVSEDGKNIQNFYIQNFLNKCPNVHLHWSPQGPKTSHTFQSFKSYTKKDIKHLFHAPSGLENALKDKTRETISLFKYKKVS